MQRRNIQLDVIFFFNKTIPEKTSGAYTNVEIHYFTETGSLQRSLDPSGDKEWIKIPPNKNTAL